MNTSPTNLNDGELPDFTKRFARQFLEGTLPLFCSHGWDGQHGGLVERLTPNLLPDPTDFCRSMVHGRQLYVYSIWGERVGQEAFVANADLVFEQLVSLFYDKQQGGWIEKVDLTGAPLSTAKILYSHAFVLFGLTAYRYCLDRTDADAYLNHTREYLAESFNRDRGLYFDALDRAGTDISADIDQNPLMHLLEATLFLSEVSGDSDALQLAGDIVERVAIAFLKDGIIVEHLTHDLSIHPDTGHIVEPGHQLEWAWLLNWYGRLVKDDAYLPICHALIDNGVAMGWDAEFGGVFDQADRVSGAVIRSTKRLWPIEEMIKAAAVFPDKFAQKNLPLEKLVNFLCDHNLHIDGRWSERLHQDLSVADPSMPASSCYHTSLALTETLNAFKA